MTKTEATALEAALEAWLRARPDGHVLTQQKTREELIAALTTTTETPFDWFKPFMTTRQP